MADDPAEYYEPDYNLRETHRVALFDEGDDGHNTIVLAGLDIVVPVELDADGDPLQDDTVSLRSLDGHSEQVRSLGDPDVRVDLEKKLVLYRFRHVLYGAYRVAVRIRRDWVQIGGRLIVARDGAFWNDTKLDDAPPAGKAADPDGLLPPDWIHESLDIDERPELACGGRLVEEEG